MALGMWKDVCNQNCYKKVYKLLADYRYTQFFNYYYYIFLMKIKKTPTLTGFFFFWVLKASVCFLSINLSNMSLCGSSSCILGDNQH